MIRKEPFAIGEYYHLYNRGIEKRIIFLDTQDYRHFIFLLYICNTIRSITLRDIGASFDRKETIVDIGAYCLMPNHFHILAKEKIENGISTYMSKILTSYSMYFNKKYRRTGRLYENTFRSSRASNDSYLKYLYSYMHLNPAKLINKHWRDQKKRKYGDLLDYVFAYPYSSLHEYIDLRFRIINPSAFPQYFMKPSDHKKELFGWLHFG